MPILTVRQHGETILWCFSRPRMVWAASTGNLHVTYADPYDREPWTNTLVFHPPWSLQVSPAIDEAQ